MKIKYEASRETFKYYNELTVISQRLKKIEKAGNIIIVNQIFKCILYIFVFAFYIFVVDRIEPTIFTNILKYISIYFLVSYLSYMILFIKNYKVFKDGNVGGTLIINENTITDEFNKCKIEDAILKAMKYGSGIYEETGWFCQKKNQPGQAKRLPRRTQIKIWSGVR